MNYPPFDVLAATELSQLARQAVVERYSPGSVILDAFDSSVDELFVVWEGRVDVWSHRDRLTELPDRTEGVGGLVGYVAALARAAVGPQAVAVGEVQCLLRSEAPDVLQAQGQEVGRLKLGPALIDRRAIAG